MKINHRVPPRRPEDKDKKEALITSPKIFRAYDIRGIYPEELNEETAYKIGQAFVEYTGAKEVVVGRDMRLSSPSLFKATTQGITDFGADVYNLGLVPTECLYFTVGYYGYDGGMMITASHNPKEYNGFKMVKKGVNWIRGVEIGKKIGEIKLLKKEKKGKVKNINIWPDYLNHLFSFVDLKKIKPFKIVVDAGNGMAGKVIPLLEPKLPIKIIPLNFELDGNFPNHPPNPLFEGASEQISKTILEKKADFGFIFDGDADRIFLIDELGNFIGGDITLLLLAQYFLVKNPGKGIAYNLICSKSVPELIKTWGGRPIRTAVGFVNVREGMLQNDGVMGGETAGHYCFKDNFYADSGFLSFLILLQLISERGEKVSQMITKLSPYTKAKEINFEIENKDEVLNEIKKQYSDGKQDYLDGLTVEYDDWWFNLRPSQTEPLLRLTIEAKTKELLEKEKKKLIETIKHFSK